MVDTICGPDSNFDCVNILVSLSSATFQPFNFYSLSSWTRLTYLLCRGSDTVVARHNNHSCYLLTSKYSQVLLVNMLTFCRPETICQVTAGAIFSGSNIKHYRDARMAK